MGKLFTSESVTEGHPDKIADQISDAILDALIAQDPYSRVAAETTVATGLALVVGEITTKAYVDISKIARDTIKEIGYVNNVDGYATDETPEYLPPAISFAHRLTRQLAKVRKDGTLPYLGPDGKSQVTGEFADDGHTVKRVHTIVISTQHSEDASLEQIRKDVIEKVIKPVIPAKLLDDDTIYYVNPTGRFVIGGPQGDAGLTGRKIIVDTYGGTGRHGGGAFSGKDPTKVDRSAAYAARWVAKNLVAAGVALFKLFSKKETAFPKPVLIIILILAGIVQALFVSGGAFLVIYCAQTLKDKKRFRATFTVVWLSIYTVMFFWQLYKGAYSKEVLIVTLFGAIPVVIASWLGSRISGKIDQKAFMLLVYIFILFVGISLVGTNLKALAAN